MLFRSNKLQLSGSQTTTGSINGANFNSSSALTQTISFTTWTTIYTMESTYGGMYLVQASNDAALNSDWCAAMICFSSGNGSAVLVQVNGVLVQLRVSGQNIQVYQNGTAPSVTLSWRVLKIGRSI